MSVMNKKGKKAKGTIVTEAGLAEAQKKNKRKRAKDKKSKKDAGPKMTIVADNRKAKHNYEILDQIECGMQLMGSEVKSMRDGKMQLDEAYIRVKDGELWLIGSDIGHYQNAGMWNHDPRRPRKLLVHRMEFNKFAGTVTQKGLTLIPLRVYFNERGIAKCIMAIGRGKKLHDKRQSIKEKDARRGLQRLNRR
ncbi:MAG: SsrA-binding protein SmpB [Planctomycetota bacterium]